MSSDPVADMKDKMSGLVSNISTGGITDNLDKIMANIMDGDVGSRGEAYTVAQFFLLACIVVGGIPFVGDALMLLLGPGLLLTGAGVTVISLNDLGASLSPWPVPASGSSLQTGGLYGELRHPTYAGLLAMAAGLSILSGSATRLLLTAILFYVLDVKSEYEEKALLETYPEYATYQATVTSKFFPESVIQELPWMKE